MSAANETPRECRPALFGMSAVHCANNCGQHCIIQFPATVNAELAAERARREEADRALRASTNYIADNETHPTFVVFANRRTVTAIDGVLHIGWTRGASPSEDEFATDALVKFGVGVLAGELEAKHKAAEGNLAEARRQLLSTTARAESAESRLKEAMEFPWTPEETARRFHKAYERLAPFYGYSTRIDTRTFDPESVNGKLMIAVVRDVLIDRAIATQEAG